MTKNAKEQPIIAREPNSEVDIARQREDYKKQKETNKNKKSKSK